MRLRLSPGEKNPTRRVADDVVDVDRQMIFRQSRSRPLGPLHQNQCPCGHDVVPAKIRELGRRLHAIEIDVKHRRVRRGILLDQRVSGTGDPLFDAVSKADRLRERSFAGAQLASECYKKRRMD